MPAVPSSLASVPLDPYLDWAARNDFRHQRFGEWLPLLVQFDAIPPEGEAGGTALASFVSLKWLDPAFKDAVRVPEIFLRPPQVIANSKDFNFCVLLVQKKAASPVTMSAGWRSRVRSMSFSSPFNPPTSPGKPPTRSIDPPTRPVDPPPLSLTGQIAEFFRQRR